MVKTDLLPNLISFGELIEDIQDIRTYIFLKNLSRKIFISYSGNALKK